MLSIKNSLCGILMLASYVAAAAPGQSAINLSVEYCSEENTGVSNDKESNIYQTLGLCNDKCQGKFTYAVLQYQECWCSNDKPSEEVDVEKCNQACPGYPDQKCGNKGAGLFAYVPLDGAPISSDNSTSTASSSGSSSSSSGSNSTTPAMTPGSSSGTNSSMSGENGNSNSNSSSDADAAVSTGDSNGLQVPRSTLALSAILSVVLGCAISFTA